MVLLSVIIQLLVFELDKFTTWDDLKGRTVLFCSPLNAITTIAVFVIILRIALFITDWGARREYFPHLQEREKVNFEKSVSNINNPNQDIADDAKKGIDQLLLLFDTKIKKDGSYNDKIQKLREAIFKK